MRTEPPVTVKNFHRTEKREFSRYEYIETTLNIAVVVVVLCSPGWRVQAPAFRCWVFLFSESPRIVKAKGFHNRQQWPTVGQQGDDQQDGLGVRSQAVEDGTLGGAEGLLAVLAIVPMFPFPICRLAGQSIFWQKAFCGFIGSTPIVW